MISFLLCTSEYSIICGPAKFVFGCLMPVVLLQVGLFPLSISTSPEISLTEIEGVLYLMLMISQVLYSATYLYLVIKDIIKEQFGYEDVLDALAITFCYIFQTILHEIYVAVISDKLRTHQILLMVTSRYWITFGFIFIISKLIMILYKANKETNGKDKKEEISASQPTHVTIGSAKSHSHHSRSSNDPAAPYERRGSVSSATSRWADVSLTPSDAISGQTAPQLACIGAAGRCALQHFNMPTSAQSGIHNPGFDFNSEAIPIGDERVETPLPDNSTVNGSMIGSVHSRIASSRASSRLDFENIEMAHPAAYNDRMGTVHIAMDE